MTFTIIRRKTVYFVFEVEAASVGKALEKTEEEFKPGKCLDIIVPAQEIVLEVTPETIEEIRERLTKPFKV